MNKVVRVVPWKRIKNNVILENDKFRISYNPIAGADKDDALGVMAQMIGGMLNGEGEPQEETALYDGDVWRILLGDFRKEYEQVWPNWKKCLAVYEKNKEANRSGWSTDEPV